MKTELPVVNSAACCAPVQPAIGRQVAEETASLFAALSDPTRVLIVNMLANSTDAVCVCDITDSFTLGQPTISHHLKILREAGLIRGEKRGKWVYYSLVLSRAVAIHAVLDTVLAAPVFA